MRFAQFKGVINFDRTSPDSGKRQNTAPSTILGAIIWRYFIDRFAHFNSRDGLSRTVVTVADGIAISQTSKY